MLVYEKRNTTIEIPLGRPPQKERNVSFLLFCLLGCLVLLEAMSRQIKKSVDQAVTKMMNPFLCVSITER